MIPENMPRCVDELTVGRLRQGWSNRKNIIVGRFGAVNTAMDREKRKNVVVIRF